MFQDSTNLPKKIDVPKKIQKETKLSILFEQSLHDIHFNDETPLEIGQLTISSKTKEYFRRFRVKRVDNQKEQKKFEIKGKDTLYFIGSPCQVQKKAYSLEIESWSRNTPKIIKNFNISLNQLEVGPNDFEFTLENSLVSSKDKSTYIGHFSTRIYCESFRQPNYVLLARDKMNTLQQESQNYEIRSGNKLYYIGSVCSIEDGKLNTLVVASFNTDSEQEGRYYDNEIKLVLLKDKMAPTEIKY